MRKLIRIENEEHESQSLWTALALFILAIPRIFVLALGRKLTYATETSRPLSVLDVMRSRRIPRVRVTRDSCMILSETAYLDGLEFTVWRGGFSWTLRIGQVERFIASRTDYLAHYGAESLTRQAEGRRAA